MPIVPAGTINTTALIVPDLFVQIVPPSTLELNGVPSNLLGFVGTAQWGPVNVPTNVGSMADYSAKFGALQNRPFDMGTHVAVATQQGANTFLCVRVSDGTDTAATFVVGTSPANITFTAKYTGSLGNSITVSIAAGAKANTWRCVVALPGQTPEVFDNISGTGAAFWANLATAINVGQNALRPASNFVIATAGTGTTAPAVATYSLATGADGVSGVDAAALIGDSAARTGMYSLAGLNVSLLDLCDMTDSTQFTTVDSFAVANSMYAIQALPAGTTVSGAVTAKQTAGLDSYSSKLMHGDFLLWNDQVNQIVRLVSPQAFAAGRLANLSPQNSGLNKPIYSVVGSQRAGVAGSSNAPYSPSELLALAQAGIDVICNPAAGNLAIWAMRLGHNSSSNPTVHGDNYTMLTNYIAKTLDLGMGYYLGRIIDRQLMNDVTATLNHFMSRLAGADLISEVDGSIPYLVVCNASNNPPESTSLGQLRADVQVHYASVLETFIVNLQGGQTIEISLTAVH